ncbi:efflux transporter outer membrane subunit [Pokkaliibacter sp. CJK22405]|uniref:efflux transporter outer membrane subunit n=1 Tax=Pokkaliibacter sp. CJK22405 TaxID=3384615 RepID=UPI003984E02C
MVLRLTLIAAVTVLTLSGCASTDGLSTHGKLMDPSTLEGKNTLGDTSQSELAWPQQQWWTQFNDPKLNALIKEALENSPSLQVADARAREAQAAVIAADAARKPTVEGEAGITRSRISRVDDPRGQGDVYGTVRNLSATASYTFDLWGGQRAAWEGAVGSAKAAEIDRQAARLTLAADVAAAYNQLGLAYAVEDIAKSDLKRARNMLKLSQQRYDAGLDSQVQLKQNQSKEAASHASLLAAEQTVKSAQIQLAVLLGKGPDRGTDIERPTLIAPDTVSLPDNLPAALAGRRPDLIAARWRVEAASKNIDSAKTSFYPNLNLSATAGVKAVLGDAIFASQSQFFNVGPAISLPIFEGGRLRSELASKDAQYDLAVANYNQSLVNAMGDIGEQITQFRSLDARIAEQTRARDIAKSSYDIAMQRYGAGIGSYLDALSVEQQLFDADQQLASLKSERVASAIKLMQALGGGYQVSDDLAAPEAKPTDAAAETH